MLASPEKKEFQKIIKDKHLINITISRDKKNTDKKRYINEPELVFDLKIILTASQGEESLFYYK